MKTLKIAPNTKIMNFKEFCKFMKDKSVYRHECGWIEKWEYNPKFSTYFPYGGFILNKKLKLTKYPYNGYPDKCLNYITTLGKPYWDFNVFRVSERKIKNTNIYYVTKQSN